MEVSPDQQNEYFFLTATLVDWVPLFSDQRYSVIVLNSLAFLRSSGNIALYAYVVMPTHIHAIISTGSKTITQIKQAFGSFTAHAIMKELKKDNRETVLIIFEKAVVDSESKHKIWQHIHAKPLLTEYVLRQELEYLHNNPTRKKWNLVENRADYLYSSAGFYDLGESGLIEVDDVRTFLDPAASGSQRGR
jgi:putative transposase